LAEQAPLTDEKDINTNSN